LSQSQVPGSEVNLFFGRREEIQQERTQAAPLQNARYIPVSGTVSAAAAAMCKQDNSCRFRGNHQIAGQPDWRDFYRFL
jgi:hypothetical protein